MMVQIVRAVVLIAASLALAAPAHANWFSTFFHSVVRDTKRRNCWPKPFNCPDVDAVWAPMDQMVSNGWRGQNMLGEHHFNLENGQLTEAGLLKLRWVLTEAPRQHRIVYIHKAETAEAVAARREVVRLAVVQIVGEAKVPQILETGISARGWPASRVADMTRRFQQAAPDPVLPSAKGQGDQ